jgi:DNA (cytosine-5)-methyltransferase 1
MNTAVDLFAGAGGASEGLRRAGFRVLSAIENDPTASSTFRRNHPSSLLIDRDIRDVSPRGLLRRIGLRQGELGLINACPPCQGFSTLGRSDPEDPRNDLVIEVERFVKTMRPWAFVLENVPGLTADRRLSALARSAQELGYGSRAFVVDATEFGVPQHRRRLIMIGVRDSVDTTFPTRLIEAVPAHLACQPPNAGSVIALSGPIDGSADPLHRARMPSPTVRARLDAIPVGGGRFDLPAAHRLPCHERLRGHRATGSYGRIRADKPAPTLTTRCTTPACGRFVHPTEPRGISLREAALLQTFPVDYQFEGSYGDIERQIGNAVPVRMAEGIGHAILALLQRRGRSRDGEA